MRILLVSLLCILLSGGIMAQGNLKSSGPVIDGYGAVWNIENPDFETRKDLEYKVVFDIYSSPEDPAQLNPAINTMARFINMHAQAGVPMENIKVACVFHNKASKDALNQKAYKAQYGVENPNLPLLEALDNAGVNLYMCGQSVESRKLGRSNLAAPIHVGLSAMTIILALESEGYRLIKF